MGAYDKFCQSCGMPMDKDPGRGGTREDGTKTQQYCSLSYAKGAFKDDFPHADALVGFVQATLKEMGYNSLKRWFFTSHIPKLERWQT